MWLGDDTTISGHKCRRANPRIDGLRYIALIGTVRCRIVIPEFEWSSSNTKHPTTLVGTWGQACGGEEKGATNLVLLTILVACANIPDTLQFVKSNETECNQEAGMPTFVI